MESGMGFPQMAAWRHRDARVGFEVAFFARIADGLRVDGHTAAVEEGEPFAVRYEIVLDEGFRTRSATIVGRSATGPAERRVEADGEGGWRIDGTPDPALDGCLDLDLEASAMTNAFPVRRMALATGAAADAPAAYVRALDLAVERLEQRYLRLDRGDGGERHLYSAPAFDVTCELVYATDGLVVDYPGLAARVL